MSKPSIPVGPDAPHGTMTRYLDFGCRCEPCKAFAAAYAKSVDARDPVSSLQRLMQWAREQGYRVGPIVEIGGMRLHIADLRQAVIDGAAPTPVYDTPENDYGLPAKDQVPTPGLDG